MCTDVGRPLFDTNMNQGIALVDHWESVHADHPSAVVGQYGLLPSTVGIAEYTHNLTFLDRSTVVDGGMEEA